MLDSFPLINKLLSGTSTRQSASQPRPQQNPHEIGDAFAQFRYALSQPKNPKCKEVWQHLYQQYIATTTRWALKHPLLKLTDQPADFFAAQALDQMWLYFAEGTGDIRHFADLRQVLIFLQTAIHSVILQHYQAQVTGKQPPGLAQVRSVLYSMAQGDLEQNWVYAHFELLLPAPLVVELFPAFGCVVTVQQVATTFLTRASENPNVKAFLATTAKLTKEDQTL